MSMRRAASCIHPLQLSVVPRGALITSGPVISSLIAPPRPSLFSLLSSFFSLHFFTAMTLISTFASFGSRPPLPQRAQDICPAGRSRHTRHSRLVVVQILQIDRRIHHVARIATGGCEHGASGSPGPAVSPLRCRTGPSPRCGNERDLSGDKDQRSRLHGGTVRTDDRRRCVIRPCTLLQRSLHARCAGQPHQTLRSRRTGHPVRRNPQIRDAHGGRHSNWISSFGGFSSAFSSSTFSTLMDRIARPDR